MLTELPWAGVDHGSPTVVRVSVNENPYVHPVARPRLPEGPKAQAALRLSESIRDRLDLIAAAKGMTRSSLLEQIVTRYVETYPLEDLD